MLRVFFEEYSQACRKLVVRFTDCGNKGNLVVRVYYGLPDQGETIDKALLLQLQESLGLQALVVLLGDFNHPAGG